MCAISLRLANQGLRLPANTAPSSLQAFAQLLTGRVPALQIVIAVGVAAGRRVIVKGDADAALGLGRTRVTVATVQAGLHFDLIWLASLGAFLRFQILFKGIRRLSFSFEIIGVVFLKLGKHFFNVSSGGRENGGIT